MDKRKRERKEVVERKQAEIWMGRVDGQKPCSGGKGSFPACRAISSAGSS